MPADGSSATPLPLAPGEHADARCGVVIIGHGHTATSLLAAARCIVQDCLPDVIAIDAGTGQTPELVARVCEAIEQVDEGRGILLIADLMGSSPCMCGVQHSAGHGFALLTGLNLALLTKLAVMDLRVSPAELAEACAESVRRSVCVKIQQPRSANEDPNESRD